MAPWLLLLLSAMCSAMGQTPTPPVSLGIEEKHAWVPPFGLEAVGRDRIARVEVVGQAAGAPTGSFHLEQFRDGQLIHVDEIAWPARPPLVVRVTLEPDTEETKLAWRAEGATREIVRQPVSRPKLEAAVSIRPIPDRHPVDLGTVFVPADGLALIPGDELEIRCVVLSREGDLGGLTLIAGLKSADGPAITMELPPKVKRAEPTLRARVPPGVDRREVWYVAIRDTTGRERWRKETPLMMVEKPPRWPAFGATATKLRFDGPISVRDPQTGRFSTQPYEEAWDARLEDVVVSLPTGDRFVFWRGSSYIPFWVSQAGTGLCYEWAEMLPPQPKDAVDCVEPLMDKELRYGRVEILESTAARVHVRWRYQSCDLGYRVWGDGATEDYYFYPDGMGSRVLTLASTPDANYEICEFIVLLPQGAYPFSVLPEPQVGLIPLDGPEATLQYPVLAEPKDLLDRFRRSDTGPSRVLYTVRAHRADPRAAVSFHLGALELPQTIFRPFEEDGQRVTPAYWGSHWPLARGNATGSKIDDRIAVTPSHLSLTSLSRPEPLSTRVAADLDTRGRSRMQQTRRWAWLIGRGEAATGRWREWAQSASQPPDVRLEGGRLESEAYAVERRAIRLVPTSADIQVELTPRPVTVNPVFEIEESPKGVPRLTLDGRPLRPEEFAWDGRTLWLNRTLHETTRLRLTFDEAPTAARALDAH